MKNDYIKKAPTQIDYESICGLDALVFYCKINYDDYSNFYINFLLKGFLDSDNFIMLSKDYENQFTYFDYISKIENVLNSDTEGGSPQKIAKIGFKNLNQRDGLFSVKIDMYSVALQQYTLTQLQEYFQALFNGFELIIQKFQLSRVDINTYIFDYNFEWLSYEYFSTKLKKNEPKYNGNTLETFYLGTRGNGLFLRVYNKLKQLNSLDYLEGNLKEFLIQKKYIQKYYKAPDYKTVWNVELELRREQLRIYNIDTLEDLNTKVNSLFKLIFTRSMRLLNQKKNNDSNDSKLQSHTVWDHIINSYNYNDSAPVVITKEKLKEYKRDNSWLNNRLNEYLKELNNNDSDINDIVHLLIKTIKEKV